MMPSLYLNTSVHADASSETQGRRFPNQRPACTQPTRQKLVTVTGQSWWNYRSASGKCRQDPHQSPISGSGKWKIPILGAAMLLCLVGFWFGEGVPALAQCTGTGLENVLPALWWCMAAFRSSSARGCGKAWRLPGSARTPRARCWRVAEEFCSFVIHNWGRPHWLSTVTFSVLKPKSWWVCSCLARD